LGSSAANSLAWVRRPARASATIRTSQTPTATPSAMSSPRITGHDGQARRSVSHPAASIPCRRQRDRARRAIISSHGRDHGGSPNRGPRWRLAGPRPTPHFTDAPGGERTRAARGPDRHRRRCPRRPAALRLRWVDLTAVPGRSSVLASHVLLPGQNARCGAHRRVEPAHDGRGAVRRRPTVRVDVRTGDGSVLLAPVRDGDPVVRRREPVDRGPGHVCLPACRSPGPTCS